MNNRIESFNYLRMLAILFIVTGHICHTITNAHNIAWYFGYTFVYVFFLLSALLLGLKYKPLLSWKGFMRKRFIRICCVYYPFLVISIAILLISKQNISFSSIAFHFTYTNYFLQSNICGVSFGHLWFMSMIMMCYFFTYITFHTEYSTRTARYLLNINTENTNVNKIKWGGVILLITLLMFLTSALHLPGRLILIIISFIFFYLNAESILKHVKKLSQHNVLIGFIIINIITITGFIYYNLDSYKVLRDWLTFLSAITWILLFYKNDSIFKKNRTIDFISNISFEIYLIHHPLILGKFSLMQFFNIPIAITVILIITIILSYFLSKIGNFIYNKLK